MRLRKSVWRNNPEQVKVKLNGKEIAPVEEGTVNYEITYENNYEVGKEAYIVIKAGKNRLQNLRRARITKFLIRTAKMQEKHP